jgi:hypothetical protein
VPGARTAPADVRIDDAARRIRVVLPPARVLAVEVTDVRTYDESPGLLNPFRPEDRDSLQAVVRLQLRRTGEEMGILAQAERNAAALLRALLGRDGYAVDVEIRGKGPVPPGPAAPVVPVPAPPPAR